MIFSLATLFLVGCLSEEKKRAIRSVETTARLKFILDAMLEYRSENKRYPNHLLKNHSWRVEILDRIKDAKVVHPFDKTQAWDSAANQMATGSNVNAFTSLRAESQSSHFTHFVLVVDEGTVFHKTGTLTDDEIGDGASETGVILELIESDIPWTEPRDITLEQAIQLIQSFPASLHPRVGYADGTVRSISPQATAEEIRAIFLANDGKTGDLF